jgi:hypothetical protein
VVPKVISVLRRGSGPTQGKLPNRRVSNEFSGLGDGGDGHLESWNPNRKLGALPSGWVRGKPLQPILVNTSKVVLIGQHNSRTYDLVE